MPHRVRTRPARAASVPRVDHDPQVLAAYLSDAAHVPGGHAAGIAFPATEAEVAAVVRSAERLLAIGAQSSLTGGATPRGEVVLSTRRLASIGPVSHGRVTVGAGVPLFELQRHLAAHHFYYAPVPTFDGAFVGGTIATNAAGAATFKYGSTRQWVSAITVVLANGEVLDLERGQTLASDERHFEIVFGSGTVVSVTLPTYTMPDVAKLSAGYFARAGMDLIDLFVGSEGTLGVVVSAGLRVVARPRHCLVLVRCAGDEQALSVTAALRREAHAAWQKRGPLDVAAIEYIDARALDVIPDDVFARIGIRRPLAGSVMLLIQIELADAEAPALEQLGELLAAAGVTDDPQVAGADDDRAAQRLVALREAVPASVNARVASAKSQVHPDIQKTAGDMVVPFERLADSIALYRRAFAKRDLDCAIWGHVSDGNLHPNVIPRSLDDVRRGEEAILEIARGVMAIGGAPLAEHGVGRSALKQQLLRELYGDNGIDEMRAVKRALDPTWKLAPGVVFPERPT